MRYKIEYENKVKEYLRIENKTYSYYIDTMGCALNENDSMKYKGILKAMGLSEAQNMEDSNVILFNTCCIRENAEKRLFGRLGKLKTKKLKNKRETYIAIVGCMTEQAQILEKIKKSYSFVDVVLGTKSMQHFAKKLYLAIKDGAKEQEAQKDLDEIIEEVPIVYNEGYKASISIIYGCNNFCSYCIVPYVRGRERSRKKEDILKDVEDVAKKGYREITLLGQNVNSYGNDFKEEKYGFVELLKAIEKVPGIDIIKFISPHPKDFSDKLIDYISKSKKVSKQIHLPLQSGSSKILQNMNRKYTKEQYLNLVEKMKKQIPGVSISTDIIVGFPGETEEDFEDTIDVIRKVKFSQIFMFCYSKRKGTLAEKMEDQISEDIKVERLQKVKKEFEILIEESNNQMINKTFAILVEGSSKKDKNKYMGRTEDNKIVVFDAKEEDVGQIKRIKIITDNKWYLTGKIEK